ncbi:MAG: ABC transporter substrate-binding protein [Zoogloeaceae bacterium]|nr:ABC transporter substrate-binding protein [Zoogloeaceae bacterium]
MLTNKTMLGLFFALSASVAQAETIKIAIGHQSMCTDTYTAGIVVKERKLLEKYLPKTGRYADAQYEISWNDYSSGGPITNQMLANKLQFGIMGDYPLIVNGAKFQAAEARTVYVAGTGYNLNGSGNAIVVPINSGIHELSDLKGKEVSTPVGSAAWGMLLKAFQDAGIRTNEYTLKNQSPAVGAGNIAANKIDAHSDFCPWSEIMEFRGTGRKIFDGFEAGVPYLHGVVVRKDFADKYPEIVIALIKATYEAGKWIEANPLEAVESLEKWTGVEKEVLYIYFSKGGHLTLDPTIKTKWIDTLKFDHQVLTREQAIPPLDFDAWIDENYIRKAYAELGVDYNVEKARLVDPKVANVNLPGEIWHARDGISTYAKTADLLKAVAAARATGAKLNATYVYDRESGLKLFGKTAYYVAEPNGEFSTFLRRGDAEKRASKINGKPISYDEAVTLVTTPQS